MSDFLHLRSDFNELLAIVAEERGIDPVLVEKDYWGSSQETEFKAR